MEQQEHQPKPVSPSVAAEVRFVSDHLWPFLSLLATAILVLAWGLDSVLAGMVGALLLGVAIALYFLHVLFARYTRKEDNRDV